MSEIALGFLLPALIYALVITRGSLDLLGWEYGWAAYNHYALALTEGRFDVPLESIGAEGFIVNGRVYMYYGLLPAIARWPLIPFIDLNQTSVSLLMTWLFCTIAAGALQLALLRIYWSKPDRTTADRLMLITASIAAWFGSGPWLALQNGSFYHEPFAAGLMLSGVFTLMLVDDVLIEKRSPSLVRLCVYALLAGLAVFARQTMAISLYMATLLLIAAPFARETRWMQLFRQAVLPSLILLSFGLVYLWTVAVRFDGDSFPMQSYGYYILYSSAPEYAEQLSRLDSIETVGQFHWSRFFPNLGWYLVGGHELRNGLVSAMGGGVTEAFGPPGRLAFGWAAAFLFALFGVWGLAKRWLLLLLVAALSVGAVFQLCYATAAYRYGVELWPPVALLMLIGVAEWLRRPVRRLWAALAFLIVGAGMVGYNFSRSANLRNDMPFEVGSLAKPMPEVLVSALNPS